MHHHWRLVMRWPANNRLFIGNDEQWRLCCAFCKCLISDSAGGRAPLFLFYACFPFFKQAIIPAHFSTYFPPFCPYQSTKSPVFSISRFFPIQNKFPIFFLANFFISWEKYYLVRNSNLLCCLALLSPNKFRSFGEGINPPGLVYLPSNAVKTYS